MGSLQYDKLCDAQRLFYKPYFSLPEYGDLKPDIVFLDAEKPVIGEIFGFNSREYLEERDRKLALADKLKEEYGFWKWDAYAKEPFPAFPVAHNPPDPMLLASSESAVSSARQEDVSFEASLQTNREVKRSRRREQWQQQALLKMAPRADQACELAEELGLWLEEAGYVEVSDDSDEKKDPPK